MKVPLQGQPFQVCSHPAGKPRETLVTREELRQPIWPGRHFLSILTTRSIQPLPRSDSHMKDEADNPRFVETLPRRGYRFIGPVDKPSFQTPRPQLLRRGDLEGLTASTPKVFG